MTASEPWTVYRTEVKTACRGLSCYCCCCYWAGQQWLSPIQFLSPLCKLPGSLGWLDWSESTKTQAVKVYSVVKRSHVGQRSKDNAKYTVITVYDQQAETWNCRWTQRWFADCNCSTCISIIIWHDFLVCLHKCGYYHMNLMHYYFKASKHMLTELDCAVHIFTI